MFDQYDKLTDSNEEFIITVHGDAEFCVNYLRPIDAGKTFKYCRIFEVATMELGEAWKIFSEWYKDCDATDPVCQHSLSYYAAYFYIDREELATITLYD